MNRRDLIKQGCGMGLCACAGAALLGEASEAAEGADDQGRQLQHLQWWQDHTKSQMAKLWELLEPHLDEKTRQEIIEQLGRNCAKRLGWAKRFKRDLKGFFRQMKESQGEDLAYDEAHGIITVTSPERDCVCGLVNSKITPPYFCHCSVGWQKETYETILGKKVDVEITESVLHGGKRCVFRIQILES
jgi:predicted hydrocarbon binding protein